MLADPAAMEQLELTFTPPLIKPVEIDPRLPNEERFALWRAANPDVEDAIVRIARHLRAGGHERGSMKMIFERLRWLHHVATKGDKYKLNNNFTSLYAREVMRTCPELRGFFETRERR